MAKIMCKNYNIRDLQLYLQKKLALTPNGIKSKMDFIGFEIQKESTWSYFEINNIKQHIQAFPIK
jgi:hypothetical protein